MGQSTSFIPNLSTLLLTQIYQRALLILFSFSQGLKIGKHNKTLCTRWTIVPHTEALFLSFVERTVFVIYLFPTKLQTCDFQGDLFIV